MNFIERINGVEGAKIIVGSGFFWAWFDALFMSAFFISPESRGSMAEAGMAAAFAFSVPVLAFVIARRSVAGRMLARRRSVIALSACGVAGSLLYVAASIGGGWAALAAGGILCGVYMAMLEVGWGTVYCHDGARSATPYVAGAFACAPIIDMPFLLMLPQASAAFFALLPLASGILFSFVSPDLRAWPSASDTPEPPSPESREIRPLLRRYLGVSGILLGAVVLVMASFGYLQHLLSFTGQAGGIADGVIVQMARGCAALAMFALFMAKPYLSSAVYRIGLLAMIAGVMMMPFVFDTDYFLVSGGIVLAGYTAFDILIWVAFSHIARAQSKDPVKTVAIMRLVAAAGCAAGSAAAMALVGGGDAMSSLAPQETTAVGYLIVIAVVLLMSGEGAAALLRGAQAPSYVAQAACDEAPLPSEDNLRGWFDSAGLTARESEIATLLAQGRTQPWIAETLSISENTVGTHVRHIYQKTDVHDRQQFIDQAISIISPERHDDMKALTGLA